MVEVFQWSFGSSLYLHKRRMSIKELVTYTVKTDF